jgi:hypothetical protein
MYDEELLPKIRKRYINCRRFAKRKIEKFKKETYYGVRERRRRIKY